MILGIDEVGRGPWAGPLVVGAVVLGGIEIAGLTDSKKLNKKRREALDLEIRSKAVGIGLGWVEPGEIDKVGMSAALKLATIRAVEQITATYHEIIIDGVVNYLKDTTKGNYVTTMKKADLLVPSVSAASIVAKVARDNYMVLQDNVYPGYGFKNHVGYGTSEHQDAINKFGVTPIHRLSFEPLKKYNRGATSVTSKQTGLRAEGIAVDFLSSKDHKILDRNWRTKLCEIDIVSEKDGAIYFTEVKYRKNSKQGDGLDAVTNSKIKQMKFAAEYYALSKKLGNINMRLAVISLSGDNFTIDNFLEI